MLAAAYFLNRKYSDHWLCYTDRKLAVLLVVRSGKRGGGGVKEGLEGAGAAQGGVA
jgi:hypothetical protein